MRNLFYGLVMSSMFLICCWLIIAYTRYGDNLQYVHLNFQATFERLTYVFGLENSRAFNGLTLFDLLNSFRDGFETISKYSFVSTALDKLSLDTTSIPAGFLLVLNAVEALINPIYALLSGVYIAVGLIAIVLDIGLYVFSFLLGIFNFVLDPVFIENIPDTATALLGV